MPSEAPTRAGRSLLAVALKPPPCGESAREPLGPVVVRLADETLRGLAGLSDSQRPRLHGFLRHAGGSQPLVQLPAAVWIVKADAGTTLQLEIGIAGIAQIGDVPRRLAKPMCTASDCTP